MSSPGCLPPTFVCASCSFFLALADARSLDSLLSVAFRPATAADAFSSLFCQPRLSVPLRLLWSRHVYGLLRRELIEHHLFLTRPRAIVFCLGREKARDITSRLACLSRLKVTIGPFRGLLLPLIPRKLLLLEEGLRTVSIEHQFVIVEGSWKSPNLYAKG